MGYAGEMVERAGQPMVDEVADAAERLWLEYYVATEEYDRTLPGAWFRDGEWMPHGDVRHLSFAFANDRDARLRREADALGLDAEAMRRAQDRVSNLGLEAQRALLRRER